MNIETGENRRNAIVKCEQMGYEIQIETIDDSKHVYYSGRFSKERYHVLHQYSTDFSDFEIQQDCVYDMMRWMS
jgi:hypothetical protein